MNSHKAILYISIMLLVPFIGGFLFTKVFQNSTESLLMSAAGSLYINGQLFFLGFVVEGIKYLRGKYKDSKKIFWLEWIETTFALWIIGVIIIGIAVSFKQFR